MRVAVIGTGIAGNAAAWTLSKHYPVTVYDRELRPGGHSHTVTIDYDGTPVAVDIGFIVYNELNYPDLTALFAHLGVETVESCMSFAVTRRRRPLRMEGRRQQLARDRHRPVRATAQSAVAVLSVDAARHPDLQPAERRGSRGRQARRTDARRIFPHAPFRAAAPRPTIWRRWALRSGRRRRARCWISRPRISSPSSATTACCNMTGRSGAPSRAAAAAMSRN